MTIRNSVITGNTVASTELLPAGFCGPHDCSFASGGGISNDGTLTLVNTRVTGNSAGASPSATVFANGGGIANSSRGRLTLLHSVVSGNVATATPPHGGGASAGGIASVGPLQIEDSLVGDNAVEFSTTLANDAEPGAFAGGIDSAGTTTIARTIVHGNRIASANVTGDALGVGGGIIVDGTLSLVDSTVDHNSVDATASAPSIGAAIAVGGGLLVAPEGRLTVGGSRIMGNSTRATNVTGAAIAAGGGLLNNGATTMRRTLVIGNSATANGLGGVAQGGGIVNDQFFGPPPVLSLTDSVVTGNRLAGSPGLAVQGGGLYTTFAVALTRTVIAGNTPDQCFGC